MQPVPRIFVSATSRDLRTARGLVSEGLRRMECLPIVQDDFPPDYKSVRDMLRAKISTCNAVVHLAGFYYGAEPQPVLPGPDRRSFTQMEYEIAMELKLPCYVFLCGKDFPFDPHEPEPEEKQQLQLAHRERLLQRDELFYEFASPEELANRTRELQLSVENLRKELAKERGRRRLAMVAAVAALFIAVVGGIWMHGRQKKTEAVTEQQSSEIAALKAQLEGPTFIVGKVNAAMTLVREQTKGTEEEMKAVAINMVATELKKPADEIKKAIDSAAELCGKLITAAQAEGKNDPAKLAASRRLEAETLEKLASAHVAAARYAEALDASTRRLALIDRVQEPEAWLDALTAVADTELEMGKSAEAGAKLKQAVEFGEADAKLGAGNRATIYATNRLYSFLFYTESDVVAAEKLMRRVVEQRETALGPEHPDTLRALGDLSKVLASREKFDEAQALSLRALKAAERVFGAEDKATMDLAVSLASVLRKMGDLDGAIKLMRRVQAYRAKALGPESATTLAGDNLFAGMLKAKGELNEAEQIYRHVLEVRQKVLGPEHPDTLLSMERIGDLLEKKEDYKGAEEIYRRVLKIREKVQGPDHPETLENLDSIAALRSYQDDPVEAEIIYRQVLALRERKSGPNHADTIASVWSVANLADSQQHYADAEPLYRRVLEAREKTLGATDPKVAESCYELACTLHELDRNEDALPLARRAVKIAEAALPEGQQNRVSYEKFLARLLAPPVPKAAPAPAQDKAIPSFADYAAFRKAIKEKADANVWKEVTEDLPAQAKGRHYVTGWIEGKELKELMRVDALSDADGTYTFYYYRNGRVASVFRVREGTATRLDGVAKATDTYNFHEGKLVGWKRTQDDKQQMEDPNDPDFAAVGQRVLAGASEAEAPILKAVGAE